jgi:hypothetical protein
MFEHNINNCYALIISAKNSDSENKNIFHQCSSLKKLGNDYCGRHIINKTNKRIRIDNYDEILSTFYKKNVNNTEQLKIIKFTDYLENSSLDNIDLIYVYNTLHMISPNKNFNFLKSDELKGKLIDYYKKIIESKKYENVYQKIQLKFRYKYNLKKRLKILNLQGPCYFNKELINNQEDFYTLDSINEVPNKFLFSFLDTNGFYYGYDIRSLKKLISTNKKVIINPYSTNMIIPNVIMRIKRMINLLELKGEKMEMNDDINLTNEQKVKSRIVRIFGIIDMFGYQTNINWLYNMNIKDLKKLYNIMEDIWNYRCDLTNYAKLEIIPTENSVPLFYIPIEYVYKLNNSSVILEIILTVFERLVSESDNEANCSLGALYVLTGLASICRDAGNVYPHLVQIDY